jgi:hypothetical protein
LFGENFFFFFKSFALLVDMAGSLASTSVSANALTVIPHTRLASLNSFFSLFVEQKEFFFAVNNGDTAARAKLFGCEGIKVLRGWMEDCRIELVRPLFSCFPFVVLTIAPFLGVGG